MTTPQVLWVLDEALIANDSELVRDCQVFLTLPTSPQGQAAHRRIMATLRVAEGQP